MPLWKYTSGLHYHFALSLEIKKIHSSIAVQPTPPHPTIPPSHHSPSHQSTIPPSHHSLLGQANMVHTWWKQYKCLSNNNNVSGTNKFPVDHFGTDGSPPSRFLCLYNKTELTKRNEERKGYIIKHCHIALAPYEKMINFLDDCMFAQ